jgi:hypothetical protein
MWNACGYLAGGFVMAAFLMKTMVWLRLFALCSNLAFIVYGLGLGLQPVWVLHLLLLPMNGWRLLEALAAIHFDCDGIATDRRDAGRTTARLLRAGWSR